MRRLLLILLLSMPLPGLARANPALEPSVWIHVEAPGPVRLERMAPGDGEWRPVCDSPCDLLVAADGVFRVGGDDVRPSPAFFVHARPGERVDVQVRRSSRTTHTLGIVGIVGGSVVATTALTVAAGQWLSAALQGMASALGSAPCALGRPCATPASSPPTPNYTPALVTALIGGAVTIAGIASLLVDGNTRAAGTDVERAPEPPTPPSEWMPPDDIAPPIVAAGMSLRIHF